MSYLERSMQPAERVEQWNESMIDQCDNGTDG